MFKQLQLIIARVTKIMKKIALASFEIRKSKSLSAFSGIIKQIITSDKYVCTFLKLC